MQIQKIFPRSLAALAATGLLAVGFGLGHVTVLHAQDAPPPPPAGEQGAPPPPPPRDGGPGAMRGPREGGPGPRGERPPPPPRPEDGEPPATPVDPQAAPAAVKTATDAAASFVPGQIWIHTAPRGEQSVQATILFQNKEVARLEFDPANGALLARGQRLPVPPPAPGNPPVPPVPTANGPAPAAPVSLGQLKARLPEIMKGLSVGRGAEIMGREGFWKVPLIDQNRVVGELHLSSDGSRIIQDFAAARDAAIFAR